MPLGCGGSSGGGLASSASNSQQQGSQTSPSELGPVGRDDTYATGQNTALYVTAQNGVLVNDTATDALLTLSSETAVGGSVRGYAEGAFFYTPPEGFVGTDEFSYSLVNRDGAAFATVRILVEQRTNGGLSVNFYDGTGRFQLVEPTDTQEFASYLQAQIAGGALAGGTGVAQADAIPMTRFALVQDPTLWSAGLARNYASQLAAEALGFDPLTAQGLLQGAQGYDQMHLDAQLFLQVAAVFKGNLLGGPDLYDNPGLKNLLLSKGLTQLANRPNVGVTDVQTLGAIGAAMNDGHLSMAEILNSGTFDNIERYDIVVEYVFSGRFRDDVLGYESAPI